VCVDSWIVREHEVDDLPEHWQVRMGQSLLARQYGAVKWAARSVEARLNQCGCRLRAVLDRADAAPKGDVIVHRLGVLGAENDVEPGVVGLVGVVVAIGEVHRVDGTVTLDPVPHALNRGVTALTGELTLTPLGQIHREGHPQMIRILPKPGSPPKFEGARTQRAVRAQGEGISGSSACWRFQCWCLALIHR
jgi:hypothetical protein